MRTIDTELFPTNIITFITKMCSRVLRFSYNLQRLSKSKICVFHKIKKMSIILPSKYTLPDGALSIIFGESPGKSFMISKPCEASTFHTVDMLY